MTQRPHHALTDCLRNCGEGASTFLHDVMRVAGEYLVATITGKRHGNVIAREFRHHERRYRRRICKWLVEVPDQIVDDVADLRRNKKLVMICAEFLRRHARVLELVVTVFVKTDREGFDGLIHVLRHQGYNSARIDST